MIFILWMCKNKQYSFITVSFELWSCPALMLLSPTVRHSFHLWPYMKRYLVAGNNLTLQCAVYLSKSVQWFRYVECIFDVWYFQLPIALSGHNPIISCEISIYIPICNYKIVIVLGVKIVTEISWIPGPALSISCAVIHFTLKTIFWGNYSCPNFVDMETEGTKI